MAKFNCYSLEMTLRRMAEMNAKRRDEKKPPTCQCLIIEDLTGLGTQHLYPAGLSMFGKIVRVMEDHYPEILGSAIVINAPSIFTMIWNLVSKFFDERTRNKIHILGSDYIDTLKELMDEDQIPQELGGKWTKSKMPTGGSVPDKYYDPTALGFTSLAIGRRANEAVTFPVKKGDKVWWEWSSGRDIGFAITHQSSENDDGKEIVAWSRETSSEGSYVASADGDLVFRFDNGFSMMRSKEVLYRIRKNLVLSAKARIATTEEEDDDSGCSKTDESGA